MLINGHGIIRLSLFHSESVKLGRESFQKANDKLDQFKNILIIHSIMKMNLNFNIC